jgi:hypothetical protein
MYDVCIIGSGQSGLVTCKTFVETNHNVIVLEKNNNTNGLFNMIQEKNYFKWSTSRAMSGFSDFPMDKTLPEWFTIQNYVDYLNSYKKHFHLDKYIQYNSEVIQCKQNEKEEWIVLYLNNGIQSSLLCKKLIICAGLNQTPKFPEIVQHYTGEIIHTEHVYRNMTKNDWEKTFSGKRVVLLGGSESAFDIGHIIVQYTNDIYFGSKNYIEWFYQGAEEGYNINIHKYVGDGWNNSIFNTPTDTNLLYPEYSLPEPMSEIWHTCGRIFLYSLTNILNYNFFNLRTTNLCTHSHKELCDKTVTPNDLFLKNVVKRTEFLIDIYENKVHIISYPNKIINKTVYTKDTTIHNVDIIVCATGYKKHFPFLDDSILQGEFIKKMIPVNTTNLAFIGYARPTMGSIASVAEMQSWWVESYFYNNLSYKIRKPVYRFKDPLNLKNDHIDTIVIGCYYLKDLAKDLRIEPNMLYLFFYDYELFKKIYTGSCHPMIYRIHGYKSYEGSRGILINTFPDFDKNRSFKEKLYFSMFLVFHIIFILFLFFLSCIITYVIYLFQKYRGKKTKYYNYLILSYFITIILILYFYLFHNN